MTVLHKIPWLLSLSLFFWIFPTGANAQNCGCDDCGIHIPEASLDTFDFEINGLTNNDLSDVNQGICGVELHFQHFRVRGLQITLVSPSGQRVVLVGNNQPVPTFTTTPGTDWNITFVPSSIPAAPDPPFGNTWLNTNNWVASRQYTGTYYPRGVGLETFAFGPANGTWQLIIQNFNPNLAPPIDYSGNLLGFRLIFCDPDGITCCFAEAGEIAGPNVEEYCQGDADLLLDPNLSLSTVPDTNLHTFNWLIGQDTTILKYDTIADLRAFPPGEYEVCGLSYLNIDKDSLWAPDGVVRIDSLRAQMERTDTSFCADISNRCLKVLIKAPPGVTTLKDTFCLGETYPIGDSTFSLPGNYDVYFSLGTGCDSLVELELTQVVPDTNFLTEIICFDSVFQVGSSIYSQTGIYLDTFPGGRFCDSIVKLDLTVLPLLQTSIDSVICFGDTVEINGNKYFENGNYQTVLLTQNGCDSTVNLNLRILNPQANIAVPPIINCSNPAIQLDGTGSTPSGSLAPFWFTSDGVITSATTTALTVMVSDSGTYELLVRQDSAGVVCTDRETVFVDLNQTAPNVQIESPDTLTCDRDQVLINGSNSSQGVDYQYVWKKIGTGVIAGATSDQLTVSDSGEYELVVLDTRNGCRDSVRIEVFEDKIDPISEAGNGFEINCQNASGQLSGVGSSTGSDFVYAWSGGGNIVSGGAGLNPTVDQPGKYFLRVENSRTGCFSIDSVEVTRDTLTPDANAGADVILNCRDSILTLTGSGSLGANFNYTWRALTGRIADQPDAFSIRVREPGIYIFEVENTNTTCSKTDTVEVGLNQNLPNSDAGTDFTLNCQFDETTLGGTGTDMGSPFFHQWYLNNSPIFGANMPMLTVSESGTYALEVLNGDNFCRDTSFVNISIDTIPPTVDAGIGFELNCTVLRDTLDAIFGTSTGANFTYQWTGTGIISGENLLEPIVNQEGWYILEVTNDDNFCSKIDSVEVTIDENLPTADAGTTDTLNCRDDFLILSGNGSAGADFQYDWTSLEGNTIVVQNPTDIRIDQPGRYVFSVTNTSNLCVKTDTVEIFVDKTPPVSDPGRDSMLNCRVTQIEIGGANTDTGNPFTHQWLLGGVPIFGETSPTLTVSESGTYGLGVLNNQNFCQTLNSVNITIDTMPPNVDAGLGFELNCTVLRDTLDAISGTSSGANFNYQWSGAGIISGANSLEPIVNQEGWYILEVTNNDNFCSKIDSVEVTIDENLPTADAGLTDTLNCRDDFLILFGNGSVGIDFEYNWISLDGNPIVFQNPNRSDIRIDQPGRYVFSVTDTSNLCLKTDTVEIFVDKDFPFSDAGRDSLLNCLVTQIEIGSSNTDTGNPFTHQWFLGGVPIVGAISPLLIASESGVYELEVLNNENACRDTSLVNITIDTIPPNVDAGLGFELNCTVLRDTLDAISGTSSGANFNYQWRGTGIISGANTLEPIVNQEGWYVLEVTNDDNFCSKIDSVEVTIDEDLPTADAGVTDTLNCRDSIFIRTGMTMNATGNYTFEWEAIDGQNLDLISQTQIRITEPGRYVFSVTNDDNLCVKTDTVEIFEDRDFPMADAGAADTLTCFRDTISIGGTGTSTAAIFNHQWILNGTLLANETDPTARIFTEGTYLLEVENTQNFCKSFSEVEIVNDINFPDAAISNGFQIDCIVKTDTLFSIGSNPSLIIDYQWLTDTGCIETNPNLAEVEVGCDGIYYLEILNPENGCRSLDSVIITQDADLPTAFAGMPDTLTCVDTFRILNGTTSIAPGDGFAFWITDDGNIISGENTLNPRINKPGIYELIIERNDNNCTDTSRVEVIELVNFPIANAGVDLEINCDTSAVIFEGGNSSTGIEFSYQWLDEFGAPISGQVNQNYQTSTEGMYILEVTNNLSQCQSFDTVSVVENIDFPTIDPLFGFTLDCVTSSDTLRGSGNAGGADFSINWTTDTGQIISASDTFDVTVSADGYYFLTLTNLENQCVSVDSVLVNSDGAFPLTAVVLDTVIRRCDPPYEVTLDGTGSSSGTNFIYQWTGPTGVRFDDPTSLITTVDSAGLFVLEVTDTSNNCQSSVPVFVIDTIFPEIILETLIELDCNDVANGIMLDASGSTQGANFSFNWAAFGATFVSGENTLMPTIDAPGIYGLEITNNLNGCVADHTVQVILGDGIPKIEAGVNSTIECDSTFVLLGTDFTSDSTDIRHVWTTIGGEILSGQGTPFITTDSVGTYILEVENLTSGCTIRDTVQVFRDRCTPGVSVAIPDTITCLVTEVRLNANGSNFRDARFEWRVISGAILGDDDTTTPLVTGGIYEFVLTDTTTNLQTTSNQILVEVDTIRPIAAAGLPQVLTCRDTFAILDGTGSSTTANFGQPIEYLWTGVGQIDDENTLMPRIREEGTFKILVSSLKNGCLDSASVLVTIDTIPPVANAGVDVIFPCDTAFVRLDGTGTQTGADIDFEWSNGDQTLEPRITAPGEYCIFVEKLSNGCRNTACVEVIADQNAPVIAAIGTDSITCVDSIFTLSATIPTGNMQVAWETPDGCILTDTSLQNIQVNCTGIYQLTVTDLNNKCTSGASVEIGLNQNFPTVDAGLGPLLSCKDTVVTLSGSTDGMLGSETYSWSGISIVSGANTLMPAVDSIGWYFLEVTDDLTGCSAMDSIEIFSNVLFPSADAGDDLELTCNIKSLTLNGLGSMPGADFEWSILTPGNFVTGQNTLEPEVDQTGEYLLKITDDRTGCSSFDTVRVTENVVVPIINLTADSLVLNCYQDTVNLNAAASTPTDSLNFRWTTLAGNIVSGSVEPTAVADSSGWYFITTERTDNGCVAKDSVFVELDRQIPSIFIAEPDTLTCSVLEVDLEALVPDLIDNFDVSWNTLSGNFVGSTDTLNARVTLPERYSARVFNYENGCENEVSVFVKIDTVAPTATAEVGTVLDCFNTSVRLQGTANSPFGNRFTFGWSTTGSGNISNPNSLDPTVDEEGSYLLTVVNLNNGCEGKDSVFVSQDASAFESYVVDIQPISCFEIPDATIVIDSIVGGSAPYIYSLDGQPFVNFGQFSGLDAGDYHVLIQDAAGCETDTMIRIESGNELLLDLGLDLTILQGDSTELEALINVPQSSIRDLTWLPTEEFNCKGCFTQTVAPIITTEYIVTAIDSNGCQATDKITLTVSAKRPVFIPAAFSPNGDGDNDVFMIYGKSDLIKIDLFQIYDRWGNIVHEAENVEPNNADFGWDGNFRGKRMNENVFVYMAVIEFKDGRTEVFEGDLTLLR